MTYSLKDAADQIRDDFAEYPAIKATVIHTKGIFDEQQEQVFLIVDSTNDEIIGIVEQWKENMPVSEKTDTEFTDMKLTPNSTVRCFVES